MKHNHAWLALAALTLTLLACSLVSPKPDRPTTDAGPAPTSGDESATSDLQTELVALPSGDAANGEKIFKTQACHTCHNDLPVGPPIPGDEPVATFAASRRPGYSAELYLYESIVEPGAFVVDGYQKDVMPADFDRQLSRQEIADLVAYLLTVK